MPLDGAVDGRDNGEGAVDGRDKPETIFVEKVCLPPPAPGERIEDARRSCLSLATSGQDCTDVREIVRWKAEEVEAAGEAAEGGGERPRGELRGPWTSVEMCSCLWLGTVEPEVVVRGGADTAREWEAEGRCEGEACGEEGDRRKKGSECQNLLAREGAWAEDDCGTGRGLVGAGAGGGWTSWTSMMVCLVAKARSSDWSLSEAS